MKQEKGAATIIEYTIVLPVVFAIVLTLFFVGYSMHQRAVMESATQRAAIYIARTITDPSYERIAEIDPGTDTNDISSATIYGDSIQNKPYRYLFAGSGRLPTSEADVIELIRCNQLFTDRTPEVNVYKQAGIFPRVTVTATQEMELPTLLPGLELPPILTIQTQSVVYVNQPAEFIRNADFVLDTLYDMFGGAIDQVVEVISKISFFQKKTS